MNLISFFGTHVNRFKYFYLRLIILFNIIHLFSHGEVVKIIAI